MTREANVVYGMYSGLALVMDVYRPETQNGYGIVYINGSGWHSPLAYSAEPLKETPLGMPYIEAMEYSGYTVFAINHRQAPRFKYPAAIEDAQRAVRYVRHNASHWGVHAERLGACGGSSGGHLVSLLGTLPGDGDSSDPDPVNRESASVQCVVARAAPVDMLSFVTSPIGSGSSVADFMGMLPRGEAEGPYSLEHRTYQEASPLHHVSANSRALPADPRRERRDRAVRAVGAHASGPEQRRRAGRAPAHSRRRSRPKFPRRHQPTRLPGRRRALVRRAPACPIAPSFATTTTS